MGTTQVRTRPGPVIEVERAQAPMSMREPLDWRVRVSALWIVLAVSMVAAFVVMSVVPAMALTPVKVVGGPANQYWPSSNGTYLAWTTVSQDGWATYVKELPGGAKKQVNPAGTDGMKATFVGSSNVLVYSQRRGEHWDIYFYDIAGGTRTKAPDAVDRAATDEWAPMASDAYILFWRQRFSTSGRLRNGWLLLYDRTAKTTRTLATGLKYYFPGFAGTTYVAWSTCGLQVGVPNCNAFYWSEASGTVALTLPEGRNQYAPAVDESGGTIYFVRAVRHACGEGVTIRRAALGSDRSTVLASLPPGIDTDWEQSVAPNTASGHLDLYFDRYRCKADTGDIYALRGVDAV